MSRVPIRVRVAAAFAVAMALVIGGAGTLLYARLGDDLAHSLDQDLRLRAQDLSAFLTDRGGSLAAESGSRLIEPGESFAQLVDDRGRVLDATRGLGGRSLMPASILAAPMRRDRFFDLPSVPGLDERARLLAVPIDRGRSRAVLVVGATLENRAEALRSLRTELLIAGPAALLLATIVGYLLGGTALRADRLERALERERGFVAEAGHELRTPLALLRAELDYALPMRAACRSASSG